MTSSPFRQTVTSGSSVAVRPVGLWRLQLPKPIELTKRSKGPGFVHYIGLMKQPSAEGSAFVTGDCLHSRLKYFQRRTSGLSLLYQAISG